MPASERILNDRRSHFATRPCHTACTVIPLGLSWALGVLPSYRVSSPCGPIGTTENGHFQQACKRFF